MAKNDNILKKIKEAFPGKNFTIEVDGNLNLLYLDGQKFGVRWSNPINNAAASNDEVALANMLISSISRVLSGTIVRGAKPAPAFKEEKKQEKVEEKQEKFEVKLPEQEPIVVTAFEPPAIDTTTAPVEEAPKSKKKSTKKKTSTPKEASEE